MEAVLLCRGRALAGKEWAPGTWLGQLGYAPEYLEFAGSFKTPEPVTGSDPSLKSQRHGSGSLSTSTGSAVTLCQTRGPAVHQRDPPVTPRSRQPAAWRGGALYRRGSSSEARLSEDGASSSGRAHTWRNTWSRTGEWKRDVLISLVPGDPLGSEGPTLPL